MIKLVTGKDGFQFAVLDQDTHIGKWCQEEGELCHDRGVALHILPHIQPGDWVIDAGANIGDHTIAYAKAVGPNGRVFAFEPYLQSYVCLTFNCRDFPWVTCINKAVGQFNAPGAFAVDSHNVGGSHIIKNGPTGAWVTTIDDLFAPRMNLIKLDVEGYEPFAVKGAKSTIASHRPTIISEVNQGALSRYGWTADGLMKLFGELGYRVEMLDKNTNATMPQFDIICFPE